MLTGLSPPSGDIRRDGIHKRACLHLPEQMIKLSEPQFQEIQNALTWDMAERLPDGHVLGSSEKMGWVKEGPDHKVAFLAQRLPLQNMTVLELGSYEGDLTVQLGRICKFVTGIEVRPSNIICALTRAFVHDVTNVRFVLGDVQEIDDSAGTYDLLFHAGLLYHMLHPVEHMFGAAKISDTLLLNTHYYTDDLSFERSDIVHDGITYKAALYKEHGMEERLSGVTEQSRWLYREDLLNLVRNVGYDQIEIARDERTKPGQKITLLAKRSKPIVRTASDITSNESTSAEKNEEFERLMNAAAQTQKLFEAAKERAEFQEAYYKNLSAQLTERQAVLERENDYYKNYSNELSKLLEGVTNSKIWKFWSSLRNAVSKTS
jgi:hypothetical protein